MRCHQGCKGPFPFAFLSQKRRKIVRELVWVVWEVGKRVRNWEKARERNNTCCNYSTKSRFNGCADVYMNEFCVYIITPKCSTWWVDWMTGLQDSENAAEGLLDSVKLRKRMQSHSGFLKEVKFQYLNLTIFNIVILAYTFLFYYITSNILLWNLEMQIYF